MISEQSRQFAHWGVSGVLSTGTDVGDLIFAMRGESNAKDYGGTIIRQLRHLYPSTKIIALTAHDYPAARESAASLHRHK